MEKCPLCHDNRYFIASKCKFEELKMLWKNKHGFDPFSQRKFSGDLSKIKCINCDIIYFSPAFFGEKDFYERISDTQSYYESNKWEFDAAVETISNYKPKSLLEIGCGDGSFLEKVNVAVERCEGVDINAVAIESAKKKGLNVSTSSLKDIKQKFDMIVSFEVFEHIENIADFFNDTLNLVETNGILLIAVPNPESYLKEMDANLLDLPPHHNLSYSKKTFDFIADRFKLKIVEYQQEPLRYIHYHGYLNSLVDYDKKLLGKSMASSLLTKLRKIILRSFSILTFVQDRKNIIGQTHLVVFQKL